MDNIYLGHLIRRLHQQSTAVFVDEMAGQGFDITPMQFAAMHGIAARDEIDQASLADRVACDRATMGGIIDRLERKGLVYRRVSAHDRRARIVSLSDEGQALLAKLEPVVQAIQPRIAGGLSERERSSLANLIANAIKAADE